MQTETLSRRSFLTGGAKILPFAAAAFAVPAVAQAALAADTEDPRLLEIGRRLEGAYREWLRTGQLFGLARERFNEIGPPVPAILVVDDDAPHIFRRSAYSYSERDFLGDAVRQADGRQRLVVTVDSAERMVAEFDGRSKNGKAARTALAAAEQYQAEKDGAEEKAGLWPAWGAHCAARTAMEEVACGVVAIPARTVRGLGIKAAAVKAMGFIGEGGMYGVTKIGNNIVDNVLAMDGPANA